MSRLPQDKAMHRRVWRICAAAEWAFAKLGTATRVEDIIDAAGMSRRSFYEEFRSLEHILARMTFAADQFGKVDIGQWLPLPDICPSADHMMCAMSLDATRGRDMSGTDFNIAFAARKGRVDAGPEPLPASEDFLKWYAETVKLG